MQFTCCAGFEGGGGGLGIPLYSVTSSIIVGGTVRVAIFRQSIIGCIAEIFNTRAPDR